MNSKNKFKEKLLEHTMKSDIICTKIKKQNTEDEITSVIHDTSENAPNYFKILRKNSLIVREFSNEENERIQNSDLIELKDKISNNQLSKNFPDSFLIHFSDKFGKRNDLNGIYEISSNSMCKQLNSENEKTISKLYQNTEGIYKHQVGEEEVETKCVFINLDSSFQNFLVRNNLNITKYKGKDDLYLANEENSWILDESRKSEAATFNLNKILLKPKQTEYEIIEGKNNSLVDNGNYYVYSDGISSYNGELISISNEGIKTLHLYSPSKVFTGLNANSSNTFTDVFKLVIGTRGETLEFEFLEKRDYCRVIENNVFVNYYRSPIQKISDSVYRYIGSTATNVSPNNYLLNKYCEKQADNQWFIYDSHYSTGINANNSNTYTVRYKLEINKYNKVITNCANLNSNLDYGRVVENNVFVNYYRNPIDRSVYYTSSDGRASSNSWKQISSDTYSWVNGWCYQRRVNWVAMPLHYEGHWYDNFVVGKLRVDRYNYITGYWSENYTIDRGQHGEDSRAGEGAFGWFQPGDTYRDMGYWEAYNP